MRPRPLLSIFFNDGSRELPSVFGRLSKSNLLPYLVGVVAGLLIFINLAVLFYMVHNNSYWNNSTDFGGYLKISKAVLIGDNPYIVKPDEYQLADKFYGAPYDQIHDMTPYPPLMAEVLIPYALVGGTIARYAWIVTLLAAFAGSLLLLMRGFGTRVPWHWCALAVGIGLSMHFIRFDIYHGQINIVLLFLLVFGLWLYKKENKVWAGIVLSLVFLVKPFYGILVLYFLWRREYKLAIISAISSVILLVAAFLPLLPKNGFKAVVDWLQSSSYYGTLPRTAMPDNQGLHGLLARLFSDNLFTNPWVASDLVLNLVRGGIIILLIGLFMVAVPFKPLSKRETTFFPQWFLVEIGFLLGLQLAYGPMTEQDHLLLLIPGLVGVLLVFYKKYITRDVSLNLWFWVAGGWILFILLQASPVRVSFGLPSDSDWYKISGLQILLTAPVALELLALSLVTGLVLFRIRRNSTPVPEITPPDPRSN